MVGGGGYFSLLVHRGAPFPLPGENPNNFLFFSFIFFSKKVVSSDSIKIRNAIRCQLRESTHSINVCVCVCVRGGQSE